MFLSIAGYSTHTKAQDLILPIENLKSILYILLLKKIRVPAFSKKKSCFIVSGFNTVKKYCWFNLKNVKSCRLKILSSLKWKKMS